MTKPLSPIHRPLAIGEFDPVDPEKEIAKDMTPPTPPRIVRLAALDSHSLSGRQHSLGPGGASAMFTQAVQRALVEEMAAQLRGQGESSGEIGVWAGQIIAAFCEE